MLIPLRDERRIKKTPYVTFTLIGLNLLVFIYQMTLGPSQINDFIARYALFPGAVTHEFFSRIQVASNPLLLKPAFLTIFTSMFIHGGLLHIFGNMLFLWVFGNNIEDTIGPVRFLGLYILSGVGAAIGHIASAPTAMIPTIGASGAIAGVLAAYLIMFPRVRIVTLVPVFFFITLIRIPALFFIGLWFVLQALQGTAALGTSAASQGIAWFAHIGGFAAGSALAFVLMPKQHREKFRERA